MPPTMTMPSEPLPPFQPAWWLPGGHAQTLWPVLTRRVRLATRTEMLELPDGDVTQLDWLDDERQRRGGDGGHSPIVILMPGLQGDLNSQYIRGLMLALGRRGWRAVLLNHRGRPEPNRFAHSYHCGLTDDIDYLTAHLHQTEPDAPLAVVGFSLGANMMLKWLGDAGRENRPLPIRTAIAVCAPFQLGRVARRIEHGFSRVYQNRMIRCLHSDVRRKLATMPGTLDLTEDELPALNTFPKFDDRITAPLHGFNGAEDYYERNRTDVLARHIRIPTRIINTDDDPLIPQELIPAPRDVSEHVTLQITRSGGHMGFVAGPTPVTPRYWLDQAIPTCLAPHLTS
jgi:hypothetical protein